MAIHNPMKTIPTILLLLTLLTPTNSLQFRVNIGGPLIKTPTQLFLPDTLSKSPFIKTPTQIYPPQSTTPLNTTPFQTNRFSSTKNDLIIKIPIPLVLRRNYLEKVRIYFGENYYNESGKRIIDVGVGSLWKKGLDVCDVGMGKGVVVEFGVGKMGGKGLWELLRGRGKGRRGVGVEFVEVVVKGVKGRGFVSGVEVFMGRGKKGGMGGGEGVKVFVEKVKGGELVEVRSMGGEESMVGMPEESTDVEMESPDVEGMEEDSFPGKKPLGAVDAGKPMGMSKEQEKGKKRPMDMEQPKGKPLDQQQPEGRPMGQQQPEGRPMGQQQPEGKPMGQQQPERRPVDQEGGKRRPMDKEQQRKPQVGQREPPMDKPISEQPRPEAMEQENSEPQETDADSSPDMEVIPSPKAPGGNGGSGIVGPTQRPRPSLRPRPNSRPRPRATPAVDDMDIDATGSPDVEDEDEDGDAEPTGSSPMETTADEEEGDQVEDDDDLVDASGSPEIDLDLEKLPKESPSEADTELNNGKDHRAHSVPGGPYVVVDVDESGDEEVTLNGQLSHSHYFTPEKVGLITDYEWSEKKTGKVLGTGPNPKIVFKVGTTIVQLKVTDNTGDVAVDFTEVTVNEGTAEGALCYYYKGHVDLDMDVDSDPRPVFSAVTPTIAFEDLKAFPEFGFQGEDFTVRCVFKNEIEKEGKVSYSITHNGLLKVYADQDLVADMASTKEMTTKTEAMSFTVGTHSWQVIYQGGKAATLVIADLKPTYDSGSVLPIITKLSESKSVPSGGGQIVISGLGFVNGIMIFFGEKKAANVIAASAEEIAVEIPAGKGKVGVYITNKVGKSNEIEFEYTSEGVDSPTKFKETFLKKKGGGAYELPQITSMTYGPDGRLYAGSIDGFIYALTVNKNLEVVDECKSGSVGKDRAVLGLAFNPMEKELKLYASTSVIYWKDMKLLGADGWMNGKIISMKPADGECMVPIEDVVTNLPVSNHDHGVNDIQFLKSGKMLVAVGGFTNAGVSSPMDKLGGVPAAPNSGAMLICDTDKGADFDGKITYDKMTDPGMAKQTGGDCRIWASGLRNTFGSIVHSSGKVYGLDNGHNFGFGDVSTGCDSEGPSDNAKDKLHLLSRGQEGGDDAPYFGFPNRNRGRSDKQQCVYEGPGSIPPLAEVDSSTNGILEYTANTFNFQLKGDLFLSQLAVQSSGQLSHAKLEADGTLAAPPQLFEKVSGIAVVQGPYGELIFAQVYKAQFPVLQPDYDAPPTTTLIAVSPHRGPKAGGIQVLVTGHNFGTKPKVMFGDEPCTDIVQVAEDGTSLKCTIPAGKGSVPVVITGADGDSPVSGADFEYF